MPVAFVCYNLSIIKDRQEAHMNQTTDTKPYEVKRSELPASCPPRGSSIDGLHPRVYLKFNADGIAKCPYCGAKYALED